MNDLYEVNMEYLKLNKPDIYSNVIDYVRNLENEVTFRLTTEQILNIECVSSEDSFFLHSKYNPQHECERWLESYEIDGNTTSDFILYGLGLTYHLAEIIDKYPHIKIFIYEPEIGVFVEALKVIEIERLLTNKNIVNLSIGKNKEALHIFTNLLYHYAKFPIRLLDIPVYRSIDSDYFLNFLKMIEKVSINKIFKIGFYETYGDQMFRNSLKNLTKMVKTPSIDILKEHFKGCTAIVVGGGPSLQYDIEYLKKIKDQCLIIAAGSSVQSLVHLGIEPHLIVSMDPGINNANVFTRNDFSELPLLYMPQIHHEIVEVHDKYNVFGYYSNDPIIRELVDVDNKDYTFIPTYSVTGTALQVAVYLGAKTVLLAGQDLSYPGKQIYSPGAIHYELKDNKKSDRALTEEVENVQGGTNPTTFSMKKTLENIEQIIRVFPAIKFINTSSKGAKIQGAEFQGIQMAYEQNKGEVYSFSDIKRIINDHKINFHPDFNQLLEKITFIVAALKEFRKSCRIVLTKIEKLHHYSKTNFYKAEKNLRNIEEIWKKVIEHRIFKEVVEEWMPLEIYRYDQRILDVYSENDIIKKAKLLDSVLGKFCGEMIEKIKVMQENFEYLLNNINSSSKIDIVKGE